MGKLEVNKILQGDALEVLKTFPNESINCIVTSPPYWALRDYGSDVETIWDDSYLEAYGIPCEHDFCMQEFKQHAGRGGVSKVGYHKLKENIPDDIYNAGFCNKCGAWKGQLGLEPTFDLYIKHLCDIFDEVKRVLRKDGTCFVNLGDTYYSISGGKFLNDNLGNKDINLKKGVSQGNELKKGKELEQKNLCNIPARFSIKMQNRGWILRNVIIWHKPNCMPSSVKDRFTVDFEYVFFFVKNKKYWFETQYEPSQYKDSNGNISDKARLQRANAGWKPGKDYPDKANVPQEIDKVGERFCPANRNKRTVWRISPKPFKEAHFAVYPEELCETPIKAGCPEFVCKKCGKPKVLDVEMEGMSSSELMKEKVRGLDNEEHLLRDKSRFKSEQGQKENMRAPREAFERKVINKGYKPTCECNEGFTGGIVLDPFFGAGTTGLVALKQGKKFIGIELNPEYIEIAERRLKPYLEQTKLA